MLVVVDEAYREFVRQDDPVDGLALVAERANVAVMRTFAKAYGLAGFRVGYVVAHEEWPPPYVRAPCLSGSPASRRPPPWRACAPSRS